MVHKSKLKRISLAVCFAFMPFAANAAGLGKLTVLSGLGEPLNAEIELLATTPEELASLTAAIAPEEAYAVQGIEKPGLHSAIKVEVKKKTNGSSLIKLSSVQPITDPFLDMLIQVDWSTGRLLREYTLLLDPPGYNVPAVAAVTSPVVTTPQSAGAPLDTPAPVSAEKATKAAPEPKKTAVTTPKPEAKPDTESKTTVKGDTLYSIAREVQPEGVSLEQVVAGLYRANKGAFIEGNMNRLKVGQIIKVPTTEELTSVPQTEASKQIRVHANDWNAYRNKLASAVGESAPSRDDAGSKAASGGKITTAAEDKAAPAPTGPRDVVKLSKGATADTKNLQDKVNSLQEEAIAREKSLKESGERTAALEKQIADMQKLLAIKNQAMAELQKNATASTTPPAPTPAPVTEKPAEPKAEAPVSAATPQPEPEPAAPEAKTEPAPAPAPEVKKPESPKPVPAPVAAPEVVAPGLLDDVDPILLGGGLAALLALAGGWLFIRNKRRRGLDGLEKDILTSGGLKANTVFGNTLGGAVGTGDTSFLADFSQSSGMIDAHDVDPIAEAEVYMAYGRDAQAEEILKDAIAKDPQRHELHHKLLEIYASRKDTSAFEAMAGELYSTVGATDPTWVKVAELGRGLEPSNPLYQVDAAALAVAASAAVPAALASEDFSSADTLSDTGAFEAAPAQTESSLDFSVDADTPAAVETSAEETTSLDFDLGGSVATEAAPADTEEVIDIAVPTTDTAVEAEALAGTDLDFQLDFPSETTPTSLPESAAENTVQLDLSELGGDAAEDNALEMPDLGFGTLEASSPAEADDANTVSFDLGALPDSPLADEKAEASATTVEDISFDLPEISAEPDVVNTSEVSFDAPSLDLPEIEAAPASPAVEDIGLPDINLGEDAPDFDKTMILNSPADDEIVFETPTATNETDFDLDIDAELPSITEAADEFIAEKPAPTAIADVEESLPEIDLSGISLDLDTGVDETSVSAADNESSEVDTKLDLVTAYMDMGDNEGARELLEEVLKEGGEQQRAKAEEILKKLG
jgi:pilus assembly protein FimV